MPKATVTVRELKNKDSGIDLSVPNYKEIPGLLGGSVQFNIVIVSNLSFFKSPQHKDSDVVQFMVSKKFGEIEEFYKLLNTKFSGTVFPPLPRKAFLMSDAIVKERRTGIEHCMKYLAAVPKIVNSPLFLEFFGVNSIKAGKLRKDEEFEVKDQTKDSEEEQTEKHDVFDDEEIGNELFVEDEEEEDELFKGSASTSENIVMFDTPDLGGGLEEGEGEELFLPEAVTVKQISVLGDKDSTEDKDNSELLRIDDDLDQLLTIKTKKPQAPLPMETHVEIEKPISTEKTRPIPAPRKLKPRTGFMKPEKPTSAKPTVPGNKPKPPLPSKPSAKGDNSQAQAPKTPTDSNVDKSNVDMSSDDIMKYISENSSADVDLELF